MHCMLFCIFGSIFNGRYRDRRRWNPKPEYGQWDVSPLERRLKALRSGLAAEDDLFPRPAVSLRVAPLKIVLKARFLKRPQVPERRCDRLPTTRPAIDGACRR